MPACTMFRVAQLLFGLADALCWFVVFLPANLQRAMSVFGVIVPTKSVLFPNHGLVWTRDLPTVANGHEPQQWLKKPSHQIQ